jgi:chromate transporter
MTEDKEKNILLKLYFIFFKIGLFTFGGGYAMLPMLRREVVDKREWATDEEMLDYYAIGQSTPGIIAINTATFTGQAKAGFFGAIFATLGMVTPSLIIIMSIARFFTEFQDNTYVLSAFAGIRVVVVVLILNAVIKMGKKSVKNWIHIVLFVAAFLFVVFTDFSPIYAVIVSGIVGMIINVVKVGDSV